MTIENKDFDITIYQHGNCHLFSLVVNELFDLDITLLIDESPIFDDFEENEFNLAALIHSYNTLYRDDDYHICFDANSIMEEEDLFNNYLQGETVQELTGSSAKDLILDWIKHGLLVDFKKGEKEKIENYLKSSLLCAK